MIKKILIYTYGNHQMGLGHIYRMHNLSQELKKNNCEVLFLTPMWKVGINKLKKFKEKIIEIPIKFFEKEIFYKNILEKYFFDSIIVDALAVDKIIMRAFKEKSRNLISFDNIGNGRVFSDLLINILYKTRYKSKKVKKEINNLDYLILNNNFREFNLKSKSIDRKVKKILISQGGSDTYGVVPRIINELKNINNNIELYILVGAAFRHKRELNNVIKSSNLKVNVLNNIKNVWEVFYNIDLAISGGGMTIFELICVGVPSMVITQEKKELETMNYLEKLKLVENLGFYKNFEKNNIFEKVQKFINNYELRKKISINGKKVIDGKGVKRIAGLIKNLDK